MSISAFMVWESHKTLTSRRGRTQSKKDHSAFGHVARSIQRLKIWPMIALPTSGIRAISLWVIC